MKTVKLHSGDDFGKDLSADYVTSILRFNILGLNKWDSLGASLLDDHRAYLAKADVFVNYILNPKLCKLGNTPAQDGRKTQENITSRHVEK